MTGLLLLIAMVALLVAALAPAHRRSATTFRPGADLRADRDHQRLLTELDAAAQRQDSGPRSVMRLLGAAGSAVTFQRPARLSPR